MSRWRWRVRRAFWNAMARLKYRAVSPLPVKDPARLRQHDGPVTPVPLSSVFPSIPISNVYVADRVPADDRAPRHLGRVVGSWLQFRLTALVPPMDAEAPQVSADPRRAVDEVFPAEHRETALRKAAACGLETRWALHPPQLPEELDGVTRLGTLALRGPYAGYLHQVGGGEYAWDLRQLGRYQHREGLRSLGTRALFRADEATRTLAPFRIESDDLGRVAPGDAQWDTAVRLLVCAVTTHTGLARHWNWVHQIGGEYLAIATRNHLPADHPIRRLLHPHVFGTHQSNRFGTLAQLTPGGDFETVFSLTHRGVCDLVGESVDAFDFTRFDPYADAAARGIDEAPLELPTEVNLRRLFDVMLRHTSRYTSIYYADDEGVRGDHAAATWVKALAALLPRGVKVNAATQSRDGLARLLAQCLFMVTAYHELVGAFLWNYQAWPHTHPVRVYRDGRAESADVFQRLINACYILNVVRAPLVDDFSPLVVPADARDPRHAAASAAFRTFREELEALQTHMEAEPRAVWKLYPRQLEVNINA